MTDTPDPIAKFLEQYKAVFESLSAAAANSSVDSVIAASKQVEELVQAVIADQPASETEQVSAEEIRKLRQEIELLRSEITELRRSGK